MKKLLCTILTLCVLLGSMGVFAMPVSAAGPSAPLSATYTLANETDGFAEGEVKIELNPSELTNRDIMLYWGNADGKLEGYSYLARIKVKEAVVTHKISAGILIPPEATHLLVYTKFASGTTLSDDCVKVELPKGAATRPYEEALAEFQVVSDIHITTDTGSRYTNYAPHYIAMLNHVVKTSGDKSLGIIINGDITQNGTAAEYNRMESLTKTVEGVPDIYLSMGNHDLWERWNGNLTLDQANKLLLNHTQLPDGTKPDDTCYDFWLGGYHFIILGTDEYSNLNATFSGATFRWLEAKLAENYDPTKPVFVFVHQNIRNTVGGSYPEQTDVDSLDRSGVINWQKLKSVLGKFESAMVFTSHSHWSMYSGTSMFTEAEQPYYFNTGAVAYIVDDYKTVSGDADYNGSSQGYYIYLYDDRVIVRGYDFVQNHWISGAQFGVKYKEYVPPVVETTTAEVTTAATTTEATEPEKTGGCKGSIVATLPVITALIGVGACTRFGRKKRK